MVDYTAAASKTQRRRGWISEELGGRREELKIVVRGISVFREESRDL
jgi:hypothetical protein